MLEDLFEILIGPWGVAGILLVTTSTGRRALRSVIKSGIHAGFAIKDAGVNVVEAIKDFEHEMSEEIKEGASNHESESEHKHPRKHAVAHH